MEEPGVGSAFQIGSWLLFVVNRLFRIFVRNTTRHQCSLQFMPPWSLHVGSAACSVNLDRLIKLGVWGIRHSNYYSSDSPSTIALVLWYPSITLLLLLKLLSKEELSVLPYFFFCIQFFVSI